jgi:hypothetical protein
VIAAAIPDAILLPTDECFAQDVPEHVYDGQGNLTGDQYIRDVLQPVGVLHFDNHPGLCIWKITPGLIVQEQ